MPSLFTEWVFWGSLASLNLLISFTVHNLTCLDLLQTQLTLGSPIIFRHRPRSPVPLISRSRSVSPSHHLSTRKFYTGPSFPPAFVYFMIVAAFMNLGNAFLRAKHIHYLSLSVLRISTLWSYLFVDLGDGTSGLSSHDSRLILSLYDWTSVVVALVFVVCSAYNFATIRALLLRENERTSITWVLGSFSHAKSGISAWSWRSWWPINADKEKDDGELEEESEKGRSDRKPVVGSPTHGRSRSQSQSLTVPPNFLRPPPFRLASRIGKKGHKRTISNGCRVSSGIGKDKRLGKLIGGIQT